MSDCGFESTRIQDFLDERLGGAERHAVADHLADCEACRKLLASYSALEALLANLPAAEPPPLLAEQVMAAVDEAAESAAPGRARAELTRTAGPVLGFLAAAGLLVSAWFVALGGASAGPWSDALAWFVEVGEAIGAGLSSLFGGLGRVSEGWNGWQTASGAQGLPWVLALGAVALATNVVAARSLRTAAVERSGGRA